MSMYLPSISLLRNFQNQSSLGNRLLLIMLTLYGFSPAATKACMCDYMYSKSTKRSSTFPPRYRHLGLFWIITISHDLSFPLKKMIIWFKFLQLKESFGRLDMSRTLLCKYMSCNAIVVSAFFGHFSVCRRQYL